MPRRDFWSVAGLYRRVEVLAGHHPTALGYIEHVCFIIGLLRHKLRVVVTHIYPKTAK